MTQEQMLTANAKHAMLSPSAADRAGRYRLRQFCLLFTTLLNRWSLQRDADPNAGSQSSFDYWRIKFENLSGIGILIYVILLTDLRDSSGSSPST